jgi:hypothetical protein
MLASQPRPDDVTVEAKPAADVLRRYWRNVVLVLVALVFVLLSFRAGLEAGMASGRIDPSFRYRIYAVPIVLSQIYYGRPYDYVGYMALEMPFQLDTPSIDELAVTLKSVENVESQGLFFIVADDKGIVDFTRVAFLLYGIRTTSLYYMYFTIMLVSCLLYVVTYFTDVHRLALLVFLCVAFYATMPGFLAYPPAISILDLHAFGMLSMAAFLHILVAATDASATRPMKLVPLVAQALILTCAYHTRASSVTQSVTIVLAYPLILWLWARRERSAPPARPILQRAFAMQYGRRLIPAAIVLIAISVLLPVYQRVMYNDGYFGRRSTLHHIVYHNLLIGLQYNPMLQESYGLGIGDLGATHAVDTYLERTNRNRGRRNWASMGHNTVTTQLPFDWVEYEEAARDLYFTIWREQPKQCLLTWLYWHPLDIYRVVRRFTGNDSADGKFAKRHAYNPFRPVYMLVVVVTVVLGTVRGRPILPAYALIAWLMLASALIVPIVFYAGGYLNYAGGFLNLAEALVAAGVMIYTSLAVAVSWLLALVRRRQVRFEAMPSTSGAAHAGGPDWRRDVG